MAKKVWKNALGQIVKLPTGEIMLSEVCCCSCQDCLNQITGLDLTISGLTGVTRSIVEDNPPFYSKWDYTGTINNLNGNYFLEKISVAGSTANFKICLTGNDPAWNPPTNVDCITGNLSNRGVLIAHEHSCSNADNIGECRGDGSDAVDTWSYVYAINVQVECVLIGGTEFIVFQSLTFDSQCVQDPSAGGGPAFVSNLLCGGMICDQGAEGGLAPEINGVGSPTCLGEFSFDDPTTGTCNDEHSYDYTAHVIGNLV